MQESKSNSTLYMNQHPTYGTKIKLANKYKLLVLSKKKKKLSRGNKQNEECVINKIINLKEKGSILLQLPSHS